MKTAILFAGQGAQAVGMGRDLVELYDVCRDLAERATACLGFDLAAVCFDGPAEDLNRSDMAQPAIFMVSAMCYEALRQECPGLQISAMAGLSLGEWTALYASGALSYEDCLSILQARGRFMQEACEATAGTMLSLMGMSADDCSSLAAECGVYAANFNSPAQTVLSGSIQGIEAAEARAKEMGKRAIRLSVAGAFHSPFMQSAADKLEQLLADKTFSAMDVPVFSNVSAMPHQVDNLADLMVDQVTSPVRWVELIGHMKADGIEQCVECGPGKVLSGLVKRIDKSLSLHNIQNVVTLDKAKTALQN